VESEKVKYYIMQKQSHQWRGEAVHEKHMSKIIKNKHTGKHKIQRDKQQGSGGVRSFLEMENVRIRSFRKSNKQRETNTSELIGVLDCVRTMWTDSNNHESQSCYTRATICSSYRPDCAVPHVCCHWGQEPLYWVSIGWAHGSSMSKILTLFWIRIC